MQSLILLIVLLVLVSCGKESSSGSSCSKKYDSVWTLLDGTAELDLVGMPLSQYTTVRAEFSGGDSCDFQLRMVGDSCSGDYRISTYAQYNGPGIVNCNDFVGDGTYRVSSSDQLYLCDSNGCSVYE